MGHDYYYDSGGLDENLQVGVSWGTDTVHQILGTIGGEHCYDKYTTPID
jgi:hypothetical protein